MAIIDFLNSSTVVGAGTEVKSADLYEAYILWANRTAAPIEPHRVFTGSVKRTVLNFAGARVHYGSHRFRDGTYARGFRGMGLAARDIDRVWVPDFVTLADAAAMTGRSFAALRADMRAARLPGYSLGEGFIVSLAAIDPTPAAALYRPLADSLAAVALVHPGTDLYDEIYGYLQEVRSARMGPLSAAVAALRPVYDSLRLAAEDEPALAPAADYLAAMVGAARTTGDGGPL